MCDVGTHVSADSQILYAQRSDDIRYCGGLNRKPYRLVCLNAWPIESDTIRKCGLVGGSMLLCWQALKFPMLKV